MATKVKDYESLKTSPRAEALRDRHLDYYADLAHRASVEVNGPDVAAWYRLLDSEYDNIVQAFNHASAGGRVTEALELSHVIFLISDRRGDARPAASFLQRALALKGRPTGVRSQAMLDQASIEKWDHSNRQTALDLVNEALAEAREASDKRMEAAALRAMGTTFVHEIGGNERALQLLHQSLSVARESGDDGAVGRTLASLAWFKIGIDDEGALADSVSALEVFRKLGDLREVSHQLLLQTSLQSERKAAEKMLEEAMAAAADAEDRAMEFQVMHTRSWRAFRAGHFHEALDIRESILKELRSGRGWPSYSAITATLSSAATSEFMLGRHQDARARLEEALQLASANHSPLDLALTKAGLAFALAFTGEVSRGSDLAEEAVALARELGGEQLHMTLILSGQLYTFIGDLERARRSLEEVRRFLPDFTAESYLSFTYNLAIVEIMEGKLEEARKLLEEGIGFKERSKILSGGPGTLERSRTALARVLRLAGNLERSDQLSASVVRTLQTAQNLPWLARALEERAALASAKGEAKRGATILGAVAQLRENIEVPLLPLDVSEVEETSSEIESALGGEVFEKAFLVGRSLRLDEAVELALA